MEYVVSSTEWSQLIEAGTPVMAEAIFRQRYATFNRCIITKLPQPLGEVTVREATKYDQIKYDMELAPAYPKAQYI